MADTDIDLWPTDLVTNMPSPVAILRRQAEALSKRTGYALGARVETFESRRGPVHKLQTEFAHRLVVTVARLENYEFVLLTVYQGLAAYPVAAELSEQAAELEPEDPAILLDEQALVSWLRTAFASPQTRQVLSTLMGIAAA